ncbi:MAG TPA: PAS domain S-box protein [Kiritimatiellia bacterium]|nr:PAS domain S-box protein [Kiritimatiellia bacterium]
MTDGQKPRTIHQQYLNRLSLANLVALLIVFPLLFAEKRRALLDDIDSTLRAVAFMARSALPADYHDRIEGPGSVSDAAYEEIVSRNNQLCAAIGLEYIWSVMLVDGRIVFTTSTSPDKIAANRRHAAFFEGHSNPAPYLKAFKTMRPVYQTNVDKWGKIRLCLLPDIDRHGRKFLFASSVSIDVVEQASVRSAFEALALCLIFFGINMILGRWIGQRIFGPLERLTVAVQAINQGESGTAASEEGGYEMATLARLVNRMSRMLHNKIDDLAASRDALIDRHNEQARLTQHELDSRERRYFGLINFAVDGILIGNKEGLITEANECMCQLFGLPREKIVGQHVKTMPFAPEENDKNPLRFDLVYAGETVTRERTIRRADGTEVVVEMRSKMMSDGLLQSIYHDITDRKRIERSLQEALALLKEAQSVAGMGAWRYDILTGESYWSDEMYAFFGVDRDFNVNDERTLLSLVHTDFHAALVKAWDLAEKEGIPYRLEVQYRRPTGEWCWMLTGGQAVYMNGVITALVGHVLDITERKRAQQVLEDVNQTLERRVKERTEDVRRYADQLRRLTERLIHAEESERKRIVHVLHEDLQQVLVASRMTLDVARQSATVRGDATADALGRTSEMISSAIQLTRSLVTTLAVPGLKEGQLSDAVASVAQQMKDKFNFEVEFAAKPGTRPVSEEVYVCFYRAIQEILFNVVKHATVLHASVVAEQLDDRFVRVTIRDGGVGFMSEDRLAEGLGVRQGMGLFGIRQSLEGLGGRLEIVSAVGKGTCVSLTLPTRTERS